MNRIIRTAAFALLPGLIAAACATARLEKALDPDSREFYSRVRYIITADERQAFLNLAPGDRKAFVEDFWRRRDPTPATAVNEYKEQYFQRIKEADHLFSGGGTSGWLQDRGRVYITLGPPDYRETYPRGVTFYGFPTEIWWYGFFPISFVDDRWVDDYRIAPESAAQIAVITQTQREWNRPGIPFDKDSADGPAPGRGPVCNVSVESDGQGSAKILARIPYSSIWLKASGSDLEANLDVSAKILDSAGAEVWASSKSCPVRIAGAELRDRLDQDYVVEMEAAVEAGSYSLKLTVTNSADGSKTEVTQDFKI